MPDDKPNEETSRFEVKGDVASHFAWLRTRMSIERTLMSLGADVHRVNRLWLYDFSVSAQVQPDTGH
jgi:hypothetical protein